MTDNNVQNYEALHKLSKNIEVLKGVSSLLNWDQETFMPEGSAEIRSEQLQILAGIEHKEKTSKKYISTLSKLIDIKTGEIHATTLPANKKAALVRWRRDYLHATSLPEKFVTEFARLTSESQMAWKYAREENAYSKFEPCLNKIIEMSRKKADYLGFQAHPYDALIDDNEPGMTTAEVTTLFSKVKLAISKLLKDITSAKSINDDFLFGNFSKDKQLMFAEELLEDMGFSKQYGRLDQSTHPFSSSCHPTDSRITTSIHPKSIMSNIFAVLHEGGHSLYEMHLPQEHYGSPLCQAISMGMHESQSRWWETRIGQEKAFWKRYLPRLKQTFKGKFDTISADTFYRAINKVTPSLIRIEADEVTYPLHVIVRFELERALIEGSLKVKELPEAWNAKTEELLSIRPKTDAEGCLQDIHWSVGAFGYFPTYTLGNMYAAHLFVCFENDHPDWERKVSQGNLRFINDWLNEKVHRYGRQFDSKELLKKSTGKTFSEKAYIDYLNNKYRTLYKI